MEVVRRAAGWAGWPLSEEQEEKLAQLGRWLSREAIPAGALGPNEAGRLEDRHLADSLLFAAGWPRSTAPPRVIDLGTGAGLPGLPLSILWGSSRLSLVERKAGRADLVRRAVRRLELENVEVVEGDAAHLDLHAEMVVARAAGPPQTVVAWAGRMVAPEGRIVLGGSWREEPAPVMKETVLEVPAEVLDRPVWLRIMAAS